MTGWMRAALCAAALAAAASVFSTAAADLQPPLPRQSPLPLLAHPPSTPHAMDPVISPAGAQGTHLNPDMAPGSVDYVYLCGDCHGAIGEGNAAKGVPPLAGRPARDLEQRLAQLRTHRGGTDWPDHGQLLAKLTQQDIDAIADYLASLVPPPAIATH